MVTQVAITSDLDDANTEGTNLDLILDPSMNKLQLKDVQVGAQT